MKKKPKSYWWKSIVKQCLFCGKDFRVKCALEIDKRKYCSRECYHKARRQYKMSDKQKQAISQANKGKVVSLETKRKLSKIAKKRIGPNSPRWKGGVRNSTQRLRYCDAYKAWQLDVFRRDGFRCQDCGVKSRVLHAHHLKPVSQYPEFIYNVENGVTLCPQCHSLRHYGKVSVGNS